MYKNAYVRAGRNGGWRAVIVHEDGSRTTKALKASSRRDAKKSLDEMLANGGPAKRGHPVGVLAKSLVDDLDAVGSVEKSTIKDYRQSQRRIERAFQGIDVEDLDRDACQRWERRLVQDGYSPTVVIKAHRLMKRVCKKAVGDGLIAKNPMEFVVPPKYKKVKPGINYLDRRERGRLLDKLAKEPAGRLRISAVIALYTGLREAEICALRWSDYDPLGHVLWVKRGIGVGEQGAYEKETKNGSKRDVVVPAGLAEELDAWRRVTTGRYILGGNRPASVNYISHAWHDLAERHGITGSEERACTFHDLRHTWATMAVAAKIDIKTVSSNLGHADASITLNTYASDDREAKVRAAAVVDGVMR